MADFDGWYRLDEIRKKKCLMNFVISARGGGKTMSMKKWMWADYVNEGKRFVYVRRRDKELLSGTMSTFFEKAQKCGLIPDDITFNYNKGLFYADGVCIGYGVSLSTSTNIRSLDFVDVGAVYFEEFVLRQAKGVGYLDKEVETFLELYSTIARSDDIPVFFLGNKLTEFNPYFLYFDVYPPERGIKVWNDMAVEVWDSEDFKQFRKKSRFGLLIENTEYGKYSIDNESLEDLPEFIARKSAKSVPMFNVRHAGKNYSVWSGRYDGNIYAEEGGVDGYQTVSVDEKGVNLLTVSGFRNRWNGLYSAYVQGLITNRIFYKNNKVQEVFRAFNKKVYFC